MENTMDLHDTKFQHQKVNHIMAGETRFQLTKSHCQNYYQDMRSDCNNDDGQSIPYIQYNWKPGLETHGPMISEK